MVPWQQQAWQEFALATRVFTGLLRTLGLPQEDLPSEWHCQFFLACDEIIISVMSWECLSFGICSPFCSEPFFLCWAGLQRQSEMWFLARQLGLVQHIYLLYMCFSNLHGTSNAYTPYKGWKQFTLIKESIAVNQLYPTSLWYLLDHLLQQHLMINALVYYSYASKNLVFASSAYFVEGPSMNSLMTLPELCIAHFNNRLKDLIKQGCCIVLNSGSPVGKQQSQMLFFP